MIQGHAVSKTITGNWKYSADELMIEQSVICEFKGAGGSYLRENIWWIKMNEFLIIFNLNDVI